MKKLISTLLSVVLISTLSIPVFAQETVSTSSDIGIKQELNNHYSGLFMPSSKFNELYGQKNSPKNLTISKDTKANITVQDVQLNKDQVTFIADIEYNNETKKLAANGTLFNGYKQQEGKNSVVGELTDEASDFKVLLFEIYNDTQPTQAITNVELETTPHLKVYLTDNNNNIVLFEIEIPKTLQGIKIENDLQPPSTNDLFWFVDVIEPTEVVELPNNEITLEIIKKETVKNQPLSVGGYTDWYHPMTYSTSYSVSGDTITNYSRPYGTWKSTHVRSSAGIWINSFKIAEYVTINGRTVSAQNLFSYKNVRLTTGVGAYSSIERAFIDGTMVGKGTGNSLTMKVFNKLWSTLTPLPSLNDIKGWINAISDMSNKTVTLGSTNIKLSDKATAGVSVDSSNYSLNSNNHYLILQSDVQYNSKISDSGSGSANGVMKVSWDVFLNNSKYSNSDRIIQFTYNARND